MEPPTPVLSYTKPPLCPVIHKQQALLILEKPGFVINIVLELKSIGFNVLNIEHVLYYAHR